MMKRFRATLIFVWSAFSNAITKVSLACDVKDARFSCPALVLYLSYLLVELLRYIVEGAKENNISLPLVLVLSVKRYLVENNVCIY
jgi:hypothetical protein